MLKSDEEARYELEFFARLDVDGAWNKLTNQPKNKSVYQTILKYAGYTAATIALFVLIGVWATHFVSTADIATVTAHRQGNDVMPGSQKAVLVLSDGSTVD